MDLRNLRYFVAVYEKKSFSAAAKYCFVAQPSISAAVNQLEKEFNSPLFSRHARGVSPNTQAKTLYPLAKNLLAQAQAVKSALMISEDKEPFTLGVTRGLGVKRMSSLLKSFTTCEPDLELTLVPPQEDCNARIILKEELLDHEKYLSLWREDYLLALPNNHKLSLKQEISFSDFDGLAFIQRTPCNAWNLLTDTLTLAGITVDVRAKIQTIDYALGLVKAGLGAALLPAHPEVLEHTDIVFKPIQGLTLNREIVIAYQQENMLTNSLVNVASQAK